MSGITVSAYSIRSTSRPAVFERTMSGNPIAIIDNLAQPASYEKGHQQVAQASTVRGTTNGDSDVTQHIATIERIARVFS